MPGRCTATGSRGAGTEPSGAERRAWRVDRVCAAAPDRPVVWISHKPEGRCAGCGIAIYKGNFIQIDRRNGLRCLACAGLADLAYLAPGDAALTRRAVAASGRSAVVVKFSVPGGGASVGVRSWSWPPSSWRGGSAPAHQLRSHVNYDLLQARSRPVEVVRQPKEAAATESSELCEQLRRWLEEGQAQTATIQSVLHNLQRFRERAEAAELRVQVADQLRHWLEATERRCEELHKELDQTRADLQRLRTEREELVQQMSEIMLRLLGKSP